MQGFSWSRKTFHGALIDLCDCFAMRALFVTMFWHRKWVEIVYGISCRNAAPFDPQSLWRSPFAARCSGYILCMPTCSRYWCWFEHCLPVYVVVTVFSEILTQAATVGLPSSGMLNPRVPLKWRLLSREDALLQGRGLAAFIAVWVMQRVQWISAPASWLMV